MEFPLSISSTVTFVADNNGFRRAFIRMGPQKFGESWDVKSASISTNSVNDCTCRMYRSTESPSRFIDGTSTANLNVTNIETTLDTLESLLFVFTGGDMGAYATVVLNGTVRNARN